MKSNKVEKKRRNMTVAIKMLKQMKFGGKIVRNFPKTFEKHLET